MFKRLTFSVLIAIIFTFVLAVSVILAGLLLLREHSETVLNGAIQNYLQSGIQVSDRMENFRLDLEADARTLFSNEEIQAIVQNPDQAAGETVFAKEASTLVSFGYTMYYYLYNITYYTSFGQVYQYGSPIDVMKDPFSSELYRKAFRYAGTIVYNGYNNTTEKYDYAILSYADDYTITGLMVFSFNKSFIYWSLLYDLMSQMDSVYIVDENNIVQASSSFRDIGSVYDGPMPDNSEESGVSRSYDQYVFFSNIKGGNNFAYPRVWRIVFTVNADKLMAPVSESMRKMMFYLAAVILVGIGATWVTAYWINRPVKKLTHAMRTVISDDSIMKKVNPGKYVTREYHILVESYNAMMEHIQKLINDVAEERLMLYDMEQRVLRNQIDAHFLCNSLQVIGLQVLEQNADQAYDMICELNHLISENLHSISSYTTISHEIEYLKRYIAIIKLKYEKKIQFRIQQNLPDKDARLPRLIIQPLVENAIVHGVSMSLTSGLIVISVEKVKDKLQIIVTDNGDGMTAKALENLLESVTAEETQKATHIGLRNVYRRLTLLYGKAMQFTLSSQLYRGTQVTIKLPYETTGQENGE